MKRREFNQHLIQGVGLVAFSALPFAMAGLLAPAEQAVAQGRRLRPPGALADDESFSTACIGCGLCGEVCPPRCIRFYRHSGERSAHTPYIDPVQKGCTLCAKCMAVCPTEALTQTPLREVRMGIAQIDRSACYPWVDRGVCGACVVVCPLGETAIGFDFANIYRPVVQSGCVGCGQCVEVCPHPSRPIRIVDAALGTVTRHPTHASLGPVRDSA